MLELLRGILKLLQVMFTLLDWWMAMVIRIVILDVDAVRMMIMRMVTLMVARERVVGWVCC